MELSTVIDSIKEFTWDILGYLIPGFLLIVVAVYILDDLNFVQPQRIINFFEITMPWIVVVLSYLAGYVLYSLSHLKDTVLGFHRNQLEALTCLEVVRKSKEAICKKSELDSDKVSLNELRSIILSTYGGLEKTTYTFMFRSDICSHLETMSILLLILGGVNYCFSLFEVEFLRSMSEIGALYLLSILAIYPLRVTRKRFYLISMKIPFSHFLAKQ